MYKIMLSIFFLLSISFSINAWDKLGDPNVRFQGVVKAPVVKTAGMDDKEAQTDPVAVTLTRIVIEPDTRQKEIVFESNALIKVLGGDITICCRHDHKGEQQLQASDYIYIKAGQKIEFSTERDTALIEITEFN